LLWVSTARFIVFNVSPLVESSHSFRICAVSAMICRRVGIDVRIDSSPGAYCSMYSFITSHCRSPDSWPWTDHSQISLIHSPTPPKCSSRAIMALINNLGIVYHQYCSSSYLDYSADHGPAYRSRQWKSSSNLITTRPPELQLQSRLPTDSDKSPKAPSTLNSPSPTLSL
jgi:hypothetical protein